MQDLEEDTNDDLTYEGVQSYITYRVNQAALRMTDPNKSLYKGQIAGNTSLIEKSAPQFYIKNPNGGVSSDAFQSFVNFPTGNAKTTLEINEMLAYAGQPMSAGYKTPNDLPGSKATVIFGPEKARLNTGEPVWAGDSLYPSAPPVDAKNGVDAHKAGLTLKQKDQMTGAYRPMTSSLAAEYMQVSHARAMKKIAEKGSFDRRDVDDWKRNHNTMYHTINEHLVTKWVFVAELMMARLIAPAGSPAEMAKILTSHNLSDARTFIYPVSGASSGARVEALAPATPEAIVEFLTLLADHMGMLSSPEKPGKTSKLITDILQSILGLGTQHGIKTQTDIGSLTTKFVPATRKLLLQSINNVDLNRSAGILHGLQKLSSMRRAVALRSRPSGRGTVPVVLLP